MIWLLSLLLAAECVPVRGPVLHGSDLAAADPQFTGLSADVTLGYAPAPGTRRIVSEAEMARLATRFSIEATAHQVCFQYAMRKLDETAVLAAMKEVLPDAQIEILETGKFDVPEGKLVFSLATLPKPPASRPSEPVVWRGHIEYSENRRFTIWAKVRITQHDVEVLRGDEVLVHVEAGAARIKFSARAESKAGVGETVKLRNPRSGKIFEALVTGKGAANLIAPLPEEVQ